ATRRLNAMRMYEPEGVHWGAFGYIEDISFSGPAAPDGNPASGGGYVHAPSITQATAAALARSAYDSHRGTPGGNPYAAVLESLRTQDADWLIQGVQQGIELSIGLGDLLEHSLRKAALDHLVDDFRAAFPIEAEGPGDQPGEVRESIGSRGACDGRRVADTYS